jgi:hypothetical protein
MWRIYSPANTGLVISTLVAKFELLEGPDRLYIGPIVYFEDEADLVAKASIEYSLFERLCFKRSAFKHECEVRVLTDTDFAPGCDPDAKYLNLRVEPSRFVEDVIVDPRASSWFVEAVKSYCRRSGIRNDPMQSDLYARDTHLTSGLVTRYEPGDGANSTSDRDHGKSA